MGPNRPSRQRVSRIFNGVARARALALARANAPVAPVPVPEPRGRQSVPLSVESRRATRV